MRAPQYSIGSCSLAIGFIFTTATKRVMLARGVSPEMFFHSLLCTAESHSAGRQMSAGISAPDLRILSIVGPVGNHALQSVGVASVIKDDPDHPIVICSMGDGTAQQGEVLEAIAEASRSELPVLFWIEDNGYSISTTTENKTFYSLPEGREQPKDLFGIPIHRVDGRDIVGCQDVVGELIQRIRSTRCRDDRHFPCTEALEPYKCRRREGLSTA